MNTTSSIIILIIFVVAYLLGSIPTGYLAGLYLKGIDIREHGSGSIGATNVLRTLGKPVAVVVLLIDSLKGALAVAMISFLPHETFPPSWDSWWVLATGILAIIGHSKSVWINFTGGKSVATTLGVLLVMNPWVGLSTLGTFLLVLAITRIVSLSSLSGAIAVSVFMYLWQQPLPYILFAIFAGVYVFWRHLSNIQRLMAGTEPKIGQKLTNI